MKTLCNKCGYEKSRQALKDAGRYEMRPGGYMHDIPWQKHGLMLEPQILIDLYFDKETEMNRLDQWYLAERGVENADQIVRPPERRINLGIMTEQARLKSGLMYQQTIMVKPTHEREKYVESMRQKGEPILMHPPVINHPGMMSAIPDEYEVLEGEGDDEKFVMKRDEQLEEARRNSADAVGRLEVWSFQDRRIGTSATPAGDSSGHGRGLVPALRSVAITETKGKGKTGGSGDPQVLNRVGRNTRVFPLNNTAPLATLASLPARPVVAPVAAKGGYPAGSSAAAPRPSVAGTTPVLRPPLVLTPAAKAGPPILTPSPSYAAPSPS